VLTVGSLFAGIGGFDLGLERAGMRVLWQCEIDPYAQRVLAKHWPDVLLLPDIRGVCADTVPAVDVICGGFPCQDLSLAGRGAGIDGERSGLWGEYARLIRELRPRYVVVENVAALLARGMGVVLGDLAACGYDAEWDCIPASAVGAPHQRDRVWLVAYPNQERRGGRPGELRTRGRGEPADGSEDVAHATGFGRLPRVERQARRQAPLGPSALGEPERRGSARGAESWPPEPDVGRVAYGVPARVDRLAGLGNALVPQIAEWLGRRIIEREGLDVSPPPGLQEAT
jgi:DNA (cytosine-5)-methyltransferase 1